MEASKVTREAFTFILLLAAVVITLGLLLYDFIPTETEMPDTLEYVSEAKVTSTKQAIADAGYSMSGDDGESLSKQLGYNELILSTRSYKSYKLNTSRASFK